MTIHVITKQHENPVEFASTSREAADEHLATLGPGGFSIHAVELRVPSTPIPTGFMPHPVDLANARLLVAQANAAEDAKYPAVAEADAIALEVGEKLLKESQIASQPKGVLHGKRQARPKT